MPESAPEQMTSIVVEPAQVVDAEQIAAIYNYYVANTVITFEEQPVTEIEMAGRISDVAALGLPWLVARSAAEPGSEQSVGTILGYAYATRWKQRVAYRYSVETTVYVHRDWHGQGLGRVLYTHLFERLQAAGVHAAVGGIALPNAASVALHESMGMTQIACFREIGFKAGRWLDVGYWQKVF